MKSPFKANRLIAPPADQRAAEKPQRGLLPPTPTGDFNRARGARLLRPAREGTGGDSGSSMHVPDRPGPDEGCSSPSSGSPARREGSPALTHVVGAGKEVDHEGGLGQVGQDGVVHDHQHLLVQPEGQLAGRQQRWVHLPHPKTHVGQSGPDPGDLPPSPPVPCA